MWNPTCPCCVLILLDCTLNSPSRNTGLNCVVTRLTFLRTCRYLSVSNDVSHICRRKKCDVPVILPESFSFLGPLKWVVTDISTVILCIYGIAEMENLFVYGLTAPPHTFALVNDNVAYSSCSLGVILPPVTFRLCLAGSECNGS